MFILFIFYALFLAYFGIFSHDTSISFCKCLSEYRYWNYARMCAHLNYYIHSCLKKRFVFIYAENYIFSCILFVKFDLDILKYKKDLLFYAKSWLCLFSTDLYSMIIFCSFLYWSNLILDWSETINSFHQLILFLSHEWREPISTIWSTSRELYAVRSLVGLN